MALQSLNKLRFLEAVAIVDATCHTALQDASKRVNIVVSILCHQRIAQKGRPLLLRLLGCAMQQVETWQKGKCE